VESADHLRCSDIAFLKRAFGKLMLNFTCWVNRKDRFGKNVFEGGFLGLDNIGVFDRSAPLPTGGYLEQADGTSWMALFAQNMMKICFQLAPHYSDYDHLAAKFGDHFLLIAHAMNRLGPDGMWDEGTGSTTTSCASPMEPPRGSRSNPWWACCPFVQRPWSNPGSGNGCRTIWNSSPCVLRRMPWLLQSIHPTGPGHFGVAGRGIAGLVGPDRLHRILSRMLEF